MSWSNWKKHSPRNTKTEAAAQQHDDTQNTKCDDPYDVPVTHVTCKIN